MHRSQSSNGIELLQAWFSGDAYDNHRHDTYAIGVTDSGLQSFDYRGATRTSSAGCVMVLHPDELHNGRAGSKSGFGYRMLYVDPKLVSTAVREIMGEARPLPFVKDSVSQNSHLANAVLIASQGNTHNQESLATDEILTLLVKGLVAADKSCVDPKRRYSIDIKAIDLATEFLSTHVNRVVHSSELEKITGLSRFDLSRQFRKTVGTSPYRYSVYRRLDYARNLLIKNSSNPRENPIISLSNLALECGFSDQAHFCRLFKAGFGISPAKYVSLQTNNPLTNTM